MTLAQFINGQTIGLNNKKCSALHLGNHNPIYSYYIAVVELVKLEICLDLGVKITYIDVVRGQNTLIGLLKELIKYSIF